LTATYRRLSSSGRPMLDEVALDQGRCPRRASALAAGSPAPRALRYPAGALAWLTGLLAVSNPADMLVTHSVFSVLSANMRNRSQSDCPPEPPAAGNPFSGDRPPAAT
jgi:hypothetical protein